MNENCKIYGNLTDGKYEIANRVYDAKYISPCIPVYGGGGLVKIAIQQATKDGTIECCDGGVADLSYPSSKTRRGRVQGGENICPTITAESNGLCRLEAETIEPSDDVVAEHYVRVRKLTPKECWRLMGFDDDSFERASKVCSNSQLYKQAGNSIVVDVLMAIFKEMIE